MNPWSARHRPGRCPGLTDGRPVGAAVVRRLECFGVSPERAASHQPRATPWATGGTDVILAFILLSLWMLLLPAARPARATDEVAIDEKLGATVPLDLQLNDETGQKVPLKVLIDKPTVLTLNYFRCAGICTPQLNDLTRTLNQIQLEPGKDFQVITVSFDPADTPEVAASKRTNYLRLMKRPFPPLAWRFLTGDAASTKRLTDAVGFHFKRQGDAFIHPAALIILSPQGKVTRYMYGITYLPFDLQMAVGEAASGLVRPTISKALDFCYSYDPAGRKYVINVTRIAGSVTLLAAAVFAAVVLFKGRRRTERASS
ncbi:MAG: SCO family protein [Candidatus Binatia bacterium]|jgi:protein SCO1